MLVELVDKLGGQHKKKDDRNKIEKTVATANCMIKTANNNFQSINQLHRTQQLLSTCTNSRSIDFITREGICASRKSLNKIVLVDDGRGTDAELESKLNESRHRTQRHR